MDLNKVMIIGRLTRDPELRTIPSGQSVANFGVATSRVWTDDQGQKQERTEFHNVVAWRKLADIAGQYLRKGRQVYVEGRLETRSWEDQTGAKRYRTEVVAENFIMLGSKPNDLNANTAVGAQAAPSIPSANQFAPNPVANQNTSAPAKSSAEEEIRVEDIPF